MGRKKSLKIESYEDFLQLMDSIQGLIREANAYHQLLMEIFENPTEYEDEFTYDPTFWKLTLNAYQAQALGFLTKVYDTQDGALSLTNLLKKIANDSKPFCNVSQNAHNFLIEVLEEDYKRVTKANAGVQKLLLLRNHKYAHVSEKATLGQLGDNAKVRLENKEIDQLIVQSNEIFSRYYSILTNSHWMLEYSRIADFKTIIEYLKVGREKVRADDELFWRVDEDERSVVRGLEGG